MMKSIIWLLFGITFGGGFVWFCLMSRKYEKEMFEDLPDMSDKWQR